MVLALLLQTAHARSRVLFATHFTLQSMRRRSQLCLGQLFGVQRIRQCVYQRCASIDVLLQSDAPQQCRSVARRACGKDLAASRVMPLDGFPFPCGERGCAFHLESSRVENTPPTFNPAPPHVSKHSPQTQLPRVAHRGYPRARPRSDARVLSHAQCSSWR